MVFVKGKEAERMSGAHRQQLELLIEKYAKTASPINKKGICGFWAVLSGRNRLKFVFIDSDEVKGFYQLNSLIDQRQVWVL